MPRCSSLHAQQCGVPNTGMQTVAAATRRVNHSGDAVPVEHFAPLEAFRNVHKTDGGLLAVNARPLQPVNGRQVLYLPCQR
ncbi:Protein of unknown function [Gryllus bimaculatus]|nr:Protein of unknown function [Gryllus bimaculatus]